MLSLRSSLAVVLVLAGAVLFAGQSAFAQRAGRPGNRPGEIDTPPARAERHAETLRAGDPAPDFVLSDPTGKTEFKLSDLRGKRPVVLIFGSYT